MASAGIARVQHPAPDFKCKAVVKGEFQDLSLSHYTSSKQWLVLVFFPLAFTFVCPTELQAFSDAMPQFASRGAAVAFASTDSEHALLAWNNMSRKDGGLGGVDVPLLSDRNMRLSRDYGVLVEDEGIALRGTFLIDPQGVVRQVTINDLPIGRSVDETLRLIDAFQYNETHGSLCPANWAKGSDTIDGSVAGNKAFLKRKYEGAEGEQNGMKKAREIVA